MLFCSEWHGCSLILGSLSLLQLEREQKHLKGIIWMTGAGASELTFCSGSQITTVLSLGI